MGTFDGGQVFKKRGPGGGNEGESTFETSEEKTEVPDIGGIMEQIDRNLNKTTNVIVVPPQQTMDEERCGC